MILVLSNIVIAIVAFLHLGFLVLEMFLRSLLLTPALPGLIGLVLTYLAN